MYVYVYIYIYIHYIYIYTLCIHVPPYLRVWSPAIVYYNMLYYSILPCTMTYYNTLYCNVCFCDLAAESRELAARQPAAENATEQEQQQRWGGILRFPACTEPHTYPAVPVAMFGLTWGPRTDPAICRNKGGAGGREWPASGDTLLSLLALFSESARAARCKRVRQHAVLVE